MPVSPEDRVVLDVARRIGELRTVRGWTQEALAERLGVSTKYVQQVEGGKENLTLRTLARIAEELDVRVTTLVRPPTSSPPRPGRPGPRYAPPFEEIEPGPDELYRTCVPLVTLEAAAGAIAQARLVEIGAWVRPRTKTKLANGMFIARIVGDSMEPEVPAGAWALFRSPPRASPFGRVVLVQHRESDDPEDAGAFLLKRLERPKRGDPRVRLVSTAARYPPLRVHLRASSDYRLIAELVEVLV